MRSTDPSALFVALFLSVPMAAQDPAQAGVRAAFAGYKASILASDGQAAVEQV